MMLWENGDDCPVCKSADLAIGAPYKLIEDMEIVADHSSHDMMNVEVRLYCENGEHITWIS